MNEIKFYLWLALRRSPAMIAIIVLCVALGVIQAIRLPAAYETEARLLFESSQLSANLVEETITTSADEEIQIIREQLLTRANLLDIANDFDVFENYAELQPDQIVASMRAATTIASEGGRNQATLIRVSFQARSGQIAADVVNEYVTRILSASAELRSGARRETVSFFEQQVDRLSSELDHRSAAISAFQAENFSALPVDQAFRLGRQAVLQERLASAQRELSSLIDQRARIIEVYESTGATPALGEAQLTLDQRQLRTLEAELANAMSIFSDTNPQVIALQRRITALRETIAASAGPAAQANPGQAVLDLQLAQIDDQIANLESVVEESQAELAQLEDAIARTPANGITLDGLQRDYDRILLQHDRAIQDLATVMASTTIEEGQLGQRLTLIEAASVPREPTSPNRKLIAAASLAVGLGLAAGLFALLEVLNRAVRRPVEITRALGITPIATIPYIETRGERFRQRAFRIVTLIVAVVGVPTALWAIDTYYIQLDVLLEQVLGLMGLA